MTDTKTILITGASSGIGEATARLFAAQGWKVSMAARRIDRLDEIKQDIEASGGQAQSIQADVMTQEDIKAMVSQSISHWGHLDVLLNNAGFGRFGWLEELDPVREIRNQIEVNLLGTILTSQAVLPHMIERKSGQIINMCSMGGLVATPTYTIYAASKFGVRGFSQALRREVSVWGIKVSAVFPGGVVTEFAEKSGSTRRKTGISTPRWLKLQSEDVAKAIYRLTIRPKSIVVLPWMMRYSVWLNNMAPSIADKIMEEQFVKPERGLK